jgi:hypothetical protein
MDAAGTKFDWPNFDHLNLAVTKGALSKAPLSRALGVQARKGPIVASQTRLFILLIGS